MPRCSISSIRAMPDIYDLADQFRDRLLRHEREAASQMVRRYAAVYRRIQDEVATILDELDADLEAGQAPSVAQLLQLQRLQQLQVQIRREVGEFAAWAEEQIQVGQAWAVDAAAADAERLMRAALGRMPPGVVVSFNRLNRAAAARIIAAMQDESPLARLLDSLGARAAERVKQELVNAVSLGWGARRTAQAIREASGETLSRALRIARTETLRAYREGTRETYKANSEIVGQWEWRSARQVRTCAACWAMDGRRFPLDVPMSEHPNGRCMQLPVIDREALGLPPGTSRRSSETGAQAFEKLSEADKRRILGPKYEAYRRGEITLADVVGVRHSEDWGDTIFEKSARTLGVGPATPPISEPIPVAPVPEPAPQPLAPDPVPVAATVPVSRAIDLKTSEPGVARALEVIDRVHGDGRLPRIPIETWQVMPQGVLGAYHTVEPFWIKIRSYGNDFVNTTIHEIGHFLDQHGLGDGVIEASEMASRRGIGPLAKWWEAASRSEAIVEKMEILDRVRELRITDVVKVLEYQLDPAEIWARSYNQYVARRSGETDVIANLKQGKRDILGVEQWTSEDFQEIETAIDEVMRSLDWRT